MFCPKCGSRLEENEKYCPNCGAKVEWEVRVSVESKMSPIKKRLPKGIVAIIVIAIVVAIGGCVSFVMGKSSKNEILCGEYCSFGGSAFYIFTPDDKSGSSGIYEESLGSLGEAVTVTGEWVMADKQVTLFDDAVVEIYSSAGEDFTDYYDGTTYLVTSDYHYLVNLEDSFEESVPNGDRFNATFTKTDSYIGNVEYVFHDNGIFEHTQALMKPSSGRYTRDGNLITMESDSGYTYKLYICNGKLCDDGYYRTEDMN